MAVRNRLHVVAMALLLGGGSAQSADDRTVGATTGSARLDAPRSTTENFEAKPATQPQISVLPTAPAPPPQTKPSKPVKSAPETHPRTSAIGTAPAPRPPPKPILPGPRPAPLEAPRPLGPVGNTTWDGFFVEGTTGLARTDRTFGGLIGTQIGKNFQFGNGVVGVSAGIDGGGPQGSFLQTNWTATVLARVGYAGFSRVMPYVAFGPAITSIDRTGLGNASALGWTISAGVNYRLDENWSAVASFGYFGFASPFHSYGGPEPNLNHGEVRSGLVYRFPYDWGRW